jgi:hypothetical protein
MLRSAYAEYEYWANSTWCKRKWCYTGGEGYHYAQSRLIQYSILNLMPPHERTWCRLLVLEFLNICTQWFPSTIYGSISQSVSRNASRAVRPKLRIGPQPRGWKMCPTASLPMPPRFIHKVLFSQSFYTHVCSFCFATLYVIVHFLTAAGPTRKFPILHTSLIAASRKHHGRYTIQSWFWTLVSANGLL